MPIYHQGRKVKEVYHQGRKVKEIWHMGRMVYSAKPTEIMPAALGTYEAQDWLRATLTKYGQNYKTVAEIPFNIDSRNTKNMYSMFVGCSALRTAPKMDTRQVTDMGYMFNMCTSLTSVPQMDTSSVTRMRSMFQNCTSLRDGNVTLTVKRAGADTYNMLYGSGLTREPFITIE